MALQYIGARYVPRFTGTYDNTQVYEALDVVDNGLGTSYIAKIPVPAGTPLTNTTYWAIYGASSGAIINLQNQIGNLTNLTTSDQTNLVNAINELDSDIQTLTNDVEIKKHKKIVMLTDSYGNRTNAASKTVGDILVDKGVDIKYYQAVSGGGFINNPPFDIADYIDSYTGNHDEITDFFFCCSANDNWGTIGNLESKIVTAISAVKASYPNARVVLVPWGVSFRNTDWAVFLKKTTPRAYHEAGAAAGAIVAKNAQYMLRHSGLMEIDLVHPNSSGVDYLANQLYGYICGSEIDVYHYIYTTPTAATGVTITENLPLLMTRHNGDVRITTNDGKGIFGNFTHSDMTGSLALTPAMNVSGTLFSSAVTHDTTDYIETLGRELADDSGWPYGYMPSNLKFTIYESANTGFDIRAIITNYQYQHTDRFQSITNLVCFSD